MTAMLMPGDNWYLTSTTPTMVSEGKEATVSEETEGEGTTVSEETEGMGILDSEGTSKEAELGDGECGGLDGSGSRGTETEDVNPWE